MECTHSCTHLNTQERAVPQERRRGAGGGAHPGAVAALPGGGVAQPEAPQRGLVALPLSGCLGCCGGEGGRRADEGGWDVTVEGTENFDSATRDAP